MNQMDDKHRYHPYYQTTNSTENFRQQYKQNYQYSSSNHLERLYQKPQMDFSNQQPKSKTYSYLPAQSTVPLMSNKTISSSTLFNAIPQERESWIRSVKKTKNNESTEQKTQYLETMLRMPQQQKSTMNSSTFDRIRFAVDQTSTTINITENNNNNLDENSFHLIGNINNHDDICTIERVLFNNELQSNTRNCSSQIINCPSTLHTTSERASWSGFLIDNCDEVELPPLSPPRLPTSTPTVEESIQPNQEDLNEQLVMLVNELNAADADQRQQSNRQKRLHKKLQKKKKKTSKTKVQEQQINKSNSVSIVNNKDCEESSSDWIIEYDLRETDHISQLTDMIKETSITMTDENKIDKINIILKKIKKQQKELRKLRQHVVSMLDEGQKLNSTNSTRQNSHTNEDLLTNFLNQPITSGCWLCSGKTYTEVAIQCNTVNEQYHW